MLSVDFCFLFFFFFFFKPKTAYEIRISDWSSDLCSSDLDALGQAAAFLGEGVEQLDDAFAVEAFVADRPADDLAHALHLVEAREVHQHREAGEELQALGKAAEHREGARDILVILDPESAHIVVLGAHLVIFEEHAIRSEEHTSELQSLMRISYAVFCLKKK